MPKVELPPDYLPIDRLIDANELEAARELLSDISESDEGYAVLRIKLGLVDGSIEPSVALQRLVQLMRRDKSWPGAQELYQVASQDAYERHTSNAAMSHVPPPVRRKD